MSNGLADNFRFHARYNAWMNQRLMDACEPLTDAERKQDRGAFFGSIHLTLHHLVMTDQVWLRRFVTDGERNGMLFPALGGGLLVPPGASDERPSTSDHWPALRTKRAQLDEAITRWVAEMPDAWLQATMRYSNSKGVERVHPAWMAMTHFFNHQTHHRSQALTLLTQAGIDIGTTDMVGLL
jgi:uncharacterized damage-inducible protein DinB